MTWDARNIAPRTIRRLRQQACRDRQHHPAAPTMSAVHPLVVHCWGRKDPPGRHSRPSGSAFRVPLCDNMSGSQNQTIERSFTRAPETRWCQVHGIAGSQADRRTGWPRLALTEQMRVVVRVSGAVGWFSYECRVWGSSFEAAAMPRFGPLQGQRCADSSRAAGRGLWVCVQ